MRRAEKILAMEFDPTMYWNYKTATAIERVVYKMTPVTCSAVERELSCVPMLPDFWWAAEIRWIHCLLRVQGNEICLDDAKMFGVLNISMQLVLTVCIGVIQGDVVFVPAKIPLPPIVRGGEIRDWEKYVITEVS